jgi:hypothetical protein
MKQNLLGFGGSLFGHGETAGDMRDATRLSQHDRSLREILFWCRVRFALPRKPCRLEQQMYLK